MMTVYNPEMDNMDKALWLDFFMQAFLDQIWYNSIHMFYFHIRDISVFPIFVSCPYIVIDVSYKYGIKT